MSTDYKECNNYPNPNLDSVEKSEGFFFSENAEKVSEKRREIDKKVEWDVKIFVEALDSYKNWLTKKLLDIYKNLENIGWMDKTTLWNKSFDILLSNKEVDNMPEKLKEILFQMLRNLTKYDKIKLERSKPLEKMMLACISLAGASESQNTAVNFWDRTFTPDNLGSSTNIA